MVPMEQPHTDHQSDPGPLTTRIVGELVPPDEPRTPAHPAPEQLEVTQPFIPAIRDETPEFAKRLNPQGPSAATAPPTVAPARPSASPQPARPAQPAQPARPSSPETNAPPATRGTTERTSAAASPPPKRRSLARRVVRRIIGPDLLRKDPAPKR